MSATEPEVDAVPAHSCPHCHESITVPLRRHRCPAQLFECCGKVYATLAQRDEHRRHVHRSKDGPALPLSARRLYSCDECDKVFTRGTSLRRHRASVHSSERLECPDCGQSFPAARPSEFKQHCLDHRFGYRCNACGYLSDRREGIVRHLSRAHKDLRASTQTGIVALERDVFDRECAKAAAARRAGRIAASSLQDLAALAPL